MRLESHLTLLNIRSIGDMADPVKYELNNGSIARIRLSAAKTALAGAPPTGDRTENFFVAAQGSSRRRTGVRARGVFYRVDIGTAAAPSIKTVFIPKLTPAALDSAPETISYKSLTWTLTSTKGEDN